MVDTSQFALPEVWKKKRQKNTGMSFTTAMYSFTQTSYIAGQYLSAKYNLNTVQYLV